MTAGKRSDFSLQDPLQDMAVAMGLFLVAMAHHGHPSTLGKFLEKSEGEFLSVILDRVVAVVDVAAFK